MGKNKIQNITTSDLKWELVEKSEVQKLRHKRQVTGVPSRFFLSSNDLLVGYGFSRCQGVALLDESLEMGALLHNHPENTPSDYILGKFKEEDKAIDPRQYFRDMSKVKAFHIYHQSNYSYPESWIETPLRKIGISSIYHIPILDKEKGRREWMEITLDVKERTIYVVPTDFSKGIMLRE